MTDTLLTASATKIQAETESNLFGILGLSYLNVMNGLSLFMKDINSFNHKQTLEETHIQDGISHKQAQDGREKIPSVGEQVVKIKAIEDGGLVREEFKQNKIIHTPLGSKQLKELVSNKQVTHFQALFDDIKRIPTLTLNPASQDKESATHVSQQHQLQSENASPRYSQQSRGNAKNKKQTVQNQFIDDRDNSKSIDREFEEYVHRESYPEGHSLNRNQEFRYSSRKYLRDFEPMIMITEINTTPRKSRLQRRSKQGRRKQSTTEINSLNKHEWSTDMIKLKQAKRRKRVLEQQLLDIKTQINILENPEKILIRPKMKQMIRIADDNDANLKALTFVKRMNNERKLKEERLKMFQERQNSEIMDRMEDMEKIGEHYFERRRVKKIEDISQRIQEYQMKREAEKKLKSLNSVFVEKVRKRAEDSLLPELEKKKSDLKRVRNLSSGNHQSIIEQYNRDIMMK